MSDNLQRKSSMTLRICLILVCLLILAATPVAAGSVTTVDKAFGDAGVIYVAGNPDNYPIEYYNGETKQFEGIVPNLLKKVADETGWSFTYLRGGEKDQRARMAANGQVEIISCVDMADADLVAALHNKSDVILSVDQNGNSHSYCMGYSEIADSALIEKMNAAFSSISSQEIVSAAVSAAGGYNPAKAHFGLICAIIRGIAVIVAIAACIVINKLRRKNETQSTDVIQKNNTLLTKEAFTEFFDMSLNDQSREVFVMVFISFDTESMARTYGMSGIGRQLSMAAKELLEYKDPDDMIMMDNIGIVMAKFAGSNESTEEWISRILETLNGEIEHSSSLYYRAGLYRLNRNDISCEEAIMNAKQSFLSAQHSGMDYMFCTNELLRTISEQRQLVEDAEAAFANREFKLFLQLTVGKNTHEIVGAEALTRWEHPKQGLLHPRAFISALADSGLIHKLDYYTFEEVCRQLSEWQKQDVKLNYYISCNFTRNTIDSRGFADEILKRAEKYEFDRSKLVIEITEDAFEVNRGQALKNITVCRNAGFRIALDDLGAGATSFADLRDYPLDMIKIDRSILKKADSEKGKALLGAIIRMGKELELETLCEGVETAEQVAVLEELDCHIMQGYYFYRPMPASVVQQHLDSRA